MPEDIETPDIETQDIPKLPPISEELLKSLNGLFPHRCAELGDTERVIWYKAGARSVIDFLITAYREQNENILTKD